MSTSIGQLSVGVSLDLAPMEKDAKKMKAQLKQLDKEYAKSGFGGGGFGSSGFGGGYGKSARARMGGGGFGGGAGAGDLGSSGAGKLAKQFGGQTLGRLVGGGGEALMGLGPGAALVAGTAAIFKLQMAVANFAKESGKLDDASLSVIRYGEALTGIGKGVKEAAMGFAVEALGTLTRFGEFVGSGFDMGAVNAANAGERDARQQEQRRDALFAANDPKQVAAVRERIKNFQRETAFNNASAKQQQDILRGEISALAAKEKQARESRRILDAETLREERLRKEEELRKNIEAHTAKQRENEEAITRSRQDRQQADKDEAKKRADESWQRTLDALSGATIDVAQQSLQRVRSQQSAIVNPFSGGAVSGFGTAAAGGSEAQRDGNRILALQLRALERQAELLEDLIARN